MENWGMEAVRQIFGFSYNDNCSTLNEKDIGPDKSNVCYLMPVRFFAGDPDEFLIARSDLKKESHKRTQFGNWPFADLGKRFAHPCDF